MKYIKENYTRFYTKTPNKSSYGDPTDLVKKISEILSEGSVLDLGAGDGRHSLYLASKGFKVKAVDLSETGLEKLHTLAAAQNLTIETELIDLNTWSIIDNYDAIVSTAVLQHLNQHSALRILGEMKEHTNTGGINVVAAFTKTGDRYILDQEEDPESFYPNDGWLKDFYKDWKIREYDTFMAPLIGRLKPDGTPMQNLVERVLAQKP